MNRKYPCEECGKKMRKRFIVKFHEALLCHNCFKKRTSIVPFGTIMPRTYVEPLTENINVGLTISQREALVNKVGFKEGYSGLSSYVRKLILKDIDWEDQKND